MPLISVIIPVYNAEKYLEQCVSSVLNQSFLDIELILVNDGSTDNSPQICDGFVIKDKRVKVLHKENGGSSDARNSGIKASIGKYLMFMDSDDFWDVTINLCKLIETLENNILFGFVLFGLSKYYPKDNTNVKENDFPEEVFDISLSKYERLRIIQENGIFPMSACTKIIRRSLLINNSLFFRKGTSGEDIIWFTDVIERVENFIVINDFFYMYRQKVAGSVTKSSKAIIDLKDIFIEITDKYKNQNTEYSKIVLGYMAYEYVILLAFIDIFDLTTQEKLRFYRWILKYDNNKKVKLANKAIRFLGYKITSKLLKFYINRI